MFNNGEIERVIAMFENKNLQRNLPYTGGSLQKETRENWRRQQYFTHGAVNSQFLIFLAGYSAGRATAAEAATTTERPETDEGE